MPVPVVSLADFRTNYPEFDDAPDTLVTAKIAQAALRMNAALWAALAPTGVMLHAAHLLATSPQGRAMKLVNKDGSTTYGKEYAIMQRTCTIGLRVF